MTKIKNLLIGSLMLIAFGLSSCTIDNDYTSSESPVISEQTVKYLVTFKNYDGTFLYATNVERNKSAVYKGANPTREEDDYFTYSFVGWDKPLNNIVADTTFTAVFSSERIPYYNVSFVNYDYSLLESSIVKKGGTAVYTGDTPTRPSTDDTEYTFIGWNKSLSAVYADTVYVAQYSSKEQGYTVEFRNYDDSLLDIQTVKYGHAATYTGSTPTRPSYGGVTYTFKGWDKSFSYITQNTVVKATYSESATICTITFKNYDGTVLLRKNVSYGSDITYTGVTPTRPFEGRYGYTFIGWDKLLDKAYDDMDFYAQFSKNIRTATTGLSYSLSGNGLIVNGYSGTATNVYIPKTALYNNNEYQVIGIGDGVFANKNIQTVFIEDNVKTIGTRAFYQCSYLTNIYLSNTLQSIGNQAFYSTSFKEIYLPSTLTTIGSQVFFGNDDLSTISIDKNNNSFAFEDGILYNYSKTRIYFGLLSNTFGNLSVKSGVTSIDNYAFYNASMTSLVLPSSVTDIGTYAFYNTSIKSVTFNNSPANIGNYAFSDCSNLSTVNLGNSLKTIGNYAFASCYIESISIPASVTFIDSQAFAYCSYLKEFVANGANSNYPIYDGIIFTANKTSFYIVPARKTGRLTIPKETTSIDFSRINAGNITEYVVESGNSYYSSYQGVLYSANHQRIIKLPTGIKSIALHSDTKMIDNETFSGTSIQSITLNEGLETIGSYAFYECDYLTSISIPNSVRSIGTYAFANCENLKTVTLGNSITVIPERCFYNDDDLTSISIPSSVKTIDTYAFGSTYSLTSVTFTSGIETIGNYAFNYSGISSFNAPSTLRSIGNNAFANSKLKSVTLNSGLTSIGDSVFYYCSYLASADLSALTQLGAGMFYNCSGLKSVQLNSSLKNIPNDCFRYCESLDSIVLPSSLTTIGSYAFYYCSFSSITLPSSLTTISSYAFSYTDLASIELPSKVAYVKDYAFSNSYLQSVVVKSTNVAISSYAFANCSYLSTVDFMTAYGSIASNAFYNTTGLTYVNLLSSHMTISNGAFPASFSGTLSIGNGNTFASSSFRGARTIILGRGFSQSTLNSMFSYSSYVYYVYCLGSRSEQTYSNSSLYNATFYYYSDTNPNDGYHYWHYNADGEIEIVETNE